VHACKHAQVRVYTHTCYALVSTRENKEKPVPNKPLLVPHGKHAAPSARNLFQYRRMCGHTFVFVCVCARVRRWEGARMRAFECGCVGAWVRGCVCLRMCWRTHTRVRASH
jgi:hypothetical protein